MEPKSPGSNPEQLPTPLEYSVPAPELGRLPEAQPEKSERSPETSQENHRATTTVPITVPSLPTPVAAPVNDGAAQDDVSFPSVAADEDLIEKEWVDKAKKIVSDTKDDPYKRERAVGKLQADYLRKRYGKELGSSTEG